jgi:hypothetical protein
MDDYIGRAESRGFRWPLGGWSYGFYRQRRHNDINAVCIAAI